MIQTFNISLIIIEDHLIGEFRSTNPSITKYEVYEKDHSITPAYWGGYIRSNTIHRRTLNSNGKMIDDEFITENNAIMIYDLF